MVYTESKTVEQPIIEWLQELGWKYVHPDDLKRGIEEPFELLTLREAIKLLNPDIIETAEDIDKVINQLRRPPNDITGNREFFEWLKGEGSLVIKPGEKAKTIRLVDYGNLEDNIFVVTNQFKFAGYQNVRFDIVLMVNGIPLALIEAKVPTRQMVDYHEAMKQVLRYWRDAPQLLKYIAVTGATDGIEFRYDWVTEDKFFEWKSTEFKDPVEGSVRGLFKKDVFLDFITNFIVFEKEREKVTKKLAMYQQVQAANKIVERVIDGKVKTGLVWHTQGSGKTLTMLFAAWKLKKLQQLENPTIIVIVDRIDLERQLWGSFSNVDLPYTAKAKSTRDLINKLKRESREVIITTVQKFEDIREVLSKRKNILVFIDEAHRTQYGKLAMRMRKAFPNATIFGFTGTPIDKGPLGASTFRTFCPPGEKYLDKYSIKQSIEDGATVRLVYLPRLVQYHIPREVLDREFLDITKDLTEEDQDRVLETSATLKNALKSRDRIEKIAKDIAEHFRTHIELNGFKAQVVAVDREACALYKEELDEHLPPEYSEVIYTPSPNDNDLLRKYHMPKEEQLNIARVTFQKPDTNPKMIIVTDMLLTGFDAPIEQVMYLDKPLRDHKLLQAIARTNRPYLGKEAGIIVDYVGIFKNLVKALNFEEQDIEGVAYDFDILKKEFDTTIKALLKIFTGVRRDDTRESLFSALRTLEDEATLKEFKEKLFKLRRLYETIAPDPVLVGYLDDYTWLIEINEAYNKFYNRRYGDLSQYQEKTKALIREKLIIKKIDRSLPTFEINKDYLKNLDEQGYSQDEKIMEMRQALDYHIKINLETNPIYETLSQRLERVLKTKKKSELLSELRRIIEEISEIEDQVKKKGVTREEYALLKSCNKYLPKADEKELIGFVKDLLASTKVELFEGWQRKVTVVKDVEKNVFDLCYEKFSGELGIKNVSSMTEDLVKFIRKYNV